MTPLIVNIYDGFTYNQLLNALRNGSIIIKIYDDFNTSTQEGELYIDYLCRLGFDYESEEYYAEFARGYKYNNQTAVAFDRFQQTDPDGIMYIPD